MAVALVLMLMSLAFASACDDDDVQPPTQSTVDGCAGGGAAGAPAAPTNVRVSGALPNLQTPAPPGQGELGRITVEWRDNSANEAGFRVYSLCQGQQRDLVEVPANTERHGPLQTCRPGNVGVAAFNSSGVPAITWAPQ